MPAAASSCSTASPVKSPKPEAQQATLREIIQRKRRLEAELIPDGNVIAAGKRANDRKAEKRSQRAPTNTDIGIGHVGEEAEQVAVEGKTSFEFKINWEWAQQEGLAWEQKTKRTLTSVAIEI
jgi:hypothetical protein